MASCERPARLGKIIDSLARFAVRTLTRPLGLDALDEALDLLLSRSKRFILATFVVRVDRSNFGLRRIARVIELLQLLVSERNSIF